MVEGYPLRRAGPPLGTAGGVPSAHGRSLERHRAQAREWAAEQITRIAEALRAAAPAIEEAAERAAEFLQRELPAAQEALAASFSELAEMVRSPAPEPEQLEPPRTSPVDEARQGIAKLEDYLRDR